MKDTPEAPARVAPVRLALGGLLALAAAMGIGRFALTPVLPFMSYGLPLTAAQAGALASANFAGYLVGALAAMSAREAWLVPGFVGALAASAATTALMAASDHLVLLAVLRFAAGLASAGVLVFASTLILERLTRSARPGLAALHFAGVGCGIALSALVVGGLGAEPGGWRVLWLGTGGVAALLACAALVCLWPALLPPKRMEAATSAATQTPARMSGDLLRLAVAYGLFGGGYVVTATFLTSILRASQTLAPFEAPVWAAVGLAAAGSVWVWGRVAARIGAASAFALACGVEALGVAASVLVPGLAGPALAALLLGGTFMGITALGLVEARRLSQGPPARALGLMTACFGLGQALAPALAGWLADLTGGFLWPSLGAAALLVAAAGLTRPPGARRA
ncbi:YbfB/YjiJ family MFS transporter [Stappia sp.]|uniref:YbfB/YjiJ family MFS transporter n=1 Tax=Stappia sp. TaxID=1870903 RepID=UPI0032D9414D